MGTSCTRFFIFVNVTQKRLVSIILFSSNVALSRLVSLCKSSCSVDQKFENIFWGNLSFKRYKRFRRRKGFSSSPQMVFFRISAFTFDISWSCCLMTSLYRKHRRIVVEQRGHLFIWISLLIVASMCLKCKGNFHKSACLEFSEAKRCQFFFFKLTIEQAADIRSYHYEVPP